MIRNNFQIAALQSWEYLSASALTNRLRWQSQSPCISSLATRAICQFSSNYSTRRLPTIRVGISYYFYSVNGAMRIAFHPLFALQCRNIMKFFCIVVLLLPLGFLF
jgi:hypothetical protein